MTTADRILCDTQSSFGITVTKLTPINGGWQNRPWRADTTLGTNLLIKQYSKERYNQSDIDNIEKALQRQIEVAKSGVPCPEIYLHNGCAIRRLEDRIDYSIMEFRHGSNLTAETISSDQLTSLGETCAALHLAFSQLPCDGVKGYPIDTAQSLEGLRANYAIRDAALTEDSPKDYVSILHAQKPILECLTCDFFDNLTKGIAHENFTPDNLLFDNHNVSAVIDFDRNCYSFILHDVGRALVSFALKDDFLDIEMVDSFMRGYSRRIPVNQNDVLNALRITWCIESLWWIQPEYFSSATGKSLRYRNEIIWLTRHWFELEELLKGR